MRLSGGSAHAQHSVKGVLISPATLLRGGAATALAGVITLVGGVHSRSPRYVLLEARAISERVLDLLPLGVPFGLVLILAVRQERWVAPLGFYPLDGGAFVRVGSSAGRAVEGWWPHWVFDVLEAESRHLCAARWLHA